MEGDLCGNDEDTLVVRSATRLPISFDMAIAAQLQKPSRAKIHGEVQRNGAFWRTVVGDRSFLYR
jgi:hypothetical protein